MPQVTSVEQYGPVRWDRMTNKPDNHLNVSTRAIATAIAD